ncbi:CheR family methyltransferase [Agrilutibacter solisilvae]|uniref:Chemotaxis protein methyltransferase n=1 Tax=Agrilutibacter solisilvae TaxID=2763317 RepID=A0A974XZ57_9GAMM|nr:CheR family methyltransferase [Lysobacter solisilvae]QSX77583.1 chemotaxis protein CheR [Lysobacter solisilvae]
MREALTRPHPDAYAAGADRHPSHERAFVFEDRDFRRVCRMIQQHAGIQLSPHKRDMVYGRLVRRLRALSLDRFDEYLDLVERDPDAEVQAFVNALTTNLTSFFREDYHFTALREQLLAAHARRPASATAPLLIWCAAASTGEEPYSLAITACEAFDTPTPPVRILATDIDTKVLQTAAAGVYGLDRIAGLDPQRRRRFFQRGTGPNAGQCRVRPELRALIEFRALNLLDADYGLAQRCTAVFCRNVMIYFDKATQYQVLRRIVPNLAPDGRLYAGHSESFHHALDLVSPCGRTVYRAAPARGGR